MAGLAWALAFPKPSLAGLAWVAPGIMLFASIGSRAGVAFRLGYVAGLVHHLVSLYWLLYIPYLPGALVGWLTLSAYLALYPAVWVWACWRVFPGQPTAPNKLQPPGISQFLASKWSYRLRWSLGGALCWVALEMIRARFLTGFPWNLLGVSQYQILPLVQLASVTGVYGVSFLIVWSSILLSGAALLLLKRSAPPHAFTSPDWSRLASGPPERWTWLNELILPVLTVTIITAWGLRQITVAPASTPMLRAALVQPSIPQTLIWNPQEDANRFEKLIRLSQQALTSPADLLVWPEAAVPNLLRYDTNRLATVAKLAQTHRVWMIVGADDAEPRSHDGPAKDTVFYNASFLVSPTGQLEARYCKQQLVIFGEYIPLQPWLPFLRWFTPVEGGFTPGRHPVPFHLNRIAASILICFEDIFPHLVRRSVQPDTDFLLNLTNNGWFGESAAQWQHAVNAVFRAVENHLPLVRCANNGLTCWVDASGRLHDVYFQDSTDVYRAGFKRVSIPLPRPGPQLPPTFYRRHGDWFGWSCVGITAVIQRPRIWRITKNRRARSAPSIPATSG